MDLPRLRGAVFDEGGTADKKWTMDESMEYVPSPVRDLGLAGFNSVGYGAGVRFEEGDQRRCGHANCCPWGAWRAGGSGG
jgi:hypothetical protein